ncbi:hypothetical protein IMG5_128570 [Ichthyophthirius multifiliis]|uniref:MHD domain-containing protein n=1 Tax=Ichthyophthirius multifiliis TaxID=5932 RepID=G0QW14_ICHMU|nr:hypothetical protein IMG5_128570 [Ichthyophthirius multifiliis]EGR30590.1 hypothetical protein IMG5_128570 [Ichthyophthirius multifiliis]|eukprot:XP_004032177.1 hypothetical protein IMG5_128570 [Ichthyophthirius multifiliis]
MISQLFILSARGDIIINRDFRSDLIKTTHEQFYRHVKLSKGDCEPLFNIDGINFSYIKRSGLYIVATSRFDNCPSILLEILNRVCVIIKDFCGLFSEEAIRKNFVLIYELLDEITDFGYPQLLSTEQVKPLIANEPVVIKKEMVPSINSTFGTIFKSQTINSNATKAPVSQDKKKNEIFVDVFEKISVLFNVSGYVINSSIEGCIQMKSYLQGNPALKLALNEDLIIGRGKIGKVVLDDCNFHESVNTSEFDINRTLRIQPPDGEFIAMNYRITSEFQPPFKIYPIIEEVSNYRLELHLRIKACFPKEVTATYVNLSFPMPKQASNITNELGKNQVNQNIDIENKNGTKIVKWNIKKFKGDTEQSLISKITLQSNANAYMARKEIGPVNVVFDIPMYNVSNLQIKYLRIEEKEKTNPFRWVRFITQSSSYVCRI